MVLGEEAVDGIASVPWRDGGGEMAASLYSPNPFHPGNKNMTSSVALMNIKLVVSV